MLFQRLEIGVRELANRVLPDRLEHVLDGYRLAAKGAGQDRAAVNEDRRHIEAAHHHHHAGQRLVAAGNADKRVIGVPAHGQLDGIGDHLARGERGLHALMAHGDAVGDGDGAELARGAAGGGDALLHGLSLTHQRDVAGGGLVPATRHADEGLMDLLAREPHRIIEGAVGRAIWTLGHVPAGQLRFESSFRVHDASPGSVPSPLRGPDIDHAHGSVWPNRGGARRDSSPHVNVLAVLPGGHRINERLRPNVTHWP